MWVKEEFFNLGFYKIGDGLTTSFWEDIWIGDSPLSHQYSSLYNMVERRYVSEHDLSQVSLNICFMMTW